MGRFAKKGNCSNCKVCKAYLRAAGSNLAKEESNPIAEKKQPLPSPGKKILQADRPDADVVLQAEGGICGCPVVEKP